MRSMLAGRTAANGQIIARGKRPTLYMKGRVNGRAYQKRLGPLWKGRDAPPPGHYTRRMAQAALDEFLVDARRDRIAGLMRTTDVRFAEAATEWLRYIRDERRRKKSTLEGYRSVLHVHLLPAL